MSNIKDAFAQGTAFIGFLTAGDPSIKKSEDYILDMVDAGADLIEIGIPFSDPIAEGPVIQAANLRALNGGATLEDCFTLVKSVRRRTRVPIVFLSYLNPIHRYGYEAFFDRCQKLGVDGIIIPDLPFEEKAEVVPYATKHDVDLISMIAPTSKARIEKIANEAKGFLYLVSSMGVTGTRAEFASDLKEMIETARMATPIPIAVGVGIHTPRQAQEIAGIADGVIVGSELVKNFAGVAADDQAAIDQARANLLAKMDELRAAIDSI